ncbi:MAG TPA: PPOX class F420-dependent oxidoreductase [Solirubrobacterales bacterium]
MSDVSLTAAERAYLEGRRLARFATAAADGRVDVAPVGLHLDGDEFVVVGSDIRHTYKYNFVRANPHAALVVDDLASTDPWRPRGVKVHGRATIEERDGREAIRLVPERKWSWGLEPE